MKIAKSISKNLVKSKTHKRSAPKKRTVNTTSLYRKLYNQYGSSKLVKHTKYVSRTECFIALYLSFYYTVIQQFKIPDHAHVFDIYIPKYNLIIEYDGKRWHKNKAKDKEIDKLAMSNGYNILRIKEDDYYKGDKLSYVKKLMSRYDLSMNTKHLTTFQKNLLKDFWK